MERFRNEPVLKAGRDIPVGEVGPGILAGLTGTEQEQGPMKAYIGEPLGGRDARSYTTASVPLYPNGHIPTPYELEERAGIAARQYETIQNLLRLLNLPSPTLAETAQGLSLMRELGYRP